MRVMLVHAEHLLGISLPVPEIHPSPTQLARASVALLDAVYLRDENVAPDAVMPPPRSRGPPPRRARCVSAGPLHPMHENTPASPVRTKDPFLHTPPPEDLFADAALPFPLCFETAS